MILGLALSINRINGMEVGQNFFAEQRIGWQLQLCKDKGLDFGDIDLIIEKVKHKLSKHNPNLLCYMVTYGLKIPLL